MRKKITVTLAAAALIAVTACGSDSSDSDTTTGATAAPAADATTAPGGDLAKAAATRTAAAREVPTKIVPTIPLTAVPPAKTVGFVICEDPSCQRLVPFLEEATGALGWKLTTVNGTAADPGAAVQQLLDAGVDFIAITGSPTALYAQQLTAAKDQGVPVLSCYSTDLPDPEGTGLFAQCSDSTSVAKTASLLVDYMVADSNAAAKVAFVSIPTFPILTAMQDGAKAAMAEACPDCTLSSIDLTIDDLIQGQSSTAIVSYLQAHPDTNYLFLSFDSLSTGLTPALDAAGLLDKVKIVGGQGGAAQMQDIIDGKNSAWVALPQEYTAWTLVDMMARLSVDMSLDEERAAAVIPQYLVDTADAAKVVVGLEAGWPGPEGFKDQFKTLWGVG